MDESSSFLEGVIASGPFRLVDGESKILVCRHATKG
jgi:hypothetical protein